MTKEQIHIIVHLECYKHFMSTRGRISLFDIALGNCAILGNETLSQVLLKISIAHPGCTIKIFVMTFTLHV